jgi:plasmid stability protein
MMQRTTLSLEDDVARKLRRRAADERKSLAHTVNDLLRLALKKSDEDAGTRRVHLKAYDVGEVLVDVNDRDALDAVMGEP